MASHLDRLDERATLPAHTAGTPKGEERIRKEGLEAGRHRKPPHRTARDSTGICAKAREPIDPRMPNLPPA
jgi:hypothetical protein